MTMFRRVVRIIALLLVAGAVFQTLSPPSSRIPTGIPHALEHFAAFVVVGAVLRLAISHRGLLVLMLAIAGLACLELLQLTIPGRHGTAKDFLVNAGGFACGYLTAWAISRHFQKAKLES
jgi:VanZ family protein